MAILCILGGAALEHARDRLPANEGPTKGNLGAIRSALHIYAQDHEGVYPRSFEALTERKRYLGSLPKTRLARHRRSDRVQLYSAPASTDAGGWGYVADPESPAYGRVFVDCTHTDPKGSVWTTY